MPSTTTGGSLVKINSAEAKRSMYKVASRPWGCMRQYRYCRPSGHVLGMARPRSIRISAKVSSSRGMPGTLSLVRVSTMSRAPVRQTICRPSLNRQRRAPFSLASQCPDLIKRRMASNRYFSTGMPMAESTVWACAFRSRSTLLQSAVITSSYNLAPRSRPWMVSSIACIMSGPGAKR